MSASKCKFNENEPFPVPEISSIEIIETGDGDKIVEFSSLGEWWVKVKILGKNFSEVNKTKI